MSDYPHPLLAREGWLFILIALLLAVGGGILWGWWSLPLWVLLLFVVQFFRDPPRVVPEGENDVLSPADGRIVSIVPCDHPYQEGRALRISVFMNVFNVHSNRSPVDGEVEQVWYHPGAFMNAALEKSAVENERNALQVRCHNGVRIVFIQVAGLIARRILCYVKQGDQLKKGQRYGFIRFGSRVDVYLPQHVDVLVVPGDKVYATTTVLARFLPLPDGASGG